MTRTMRLSSTLAIAGWLVAVALPAAAAEANAVDAATAEAAAAGAVCPVGALKAEQLQVRQQDAIDDIGRMLAEQAPRDPDFQVLNTTGYNYAPTSLGASKLPPGIPTR